MYKVKVKSKGYNGVRAGVHFSMGEATFEDEKLVKVFKRLGYEVTKLETKETQKDAEPIKKEVKKAPAKRKAPAKKKKEE